MRRLCFASVLALLGCEASAHATAVPQRSPVLVELFTSQGCSSCPPADRLLLELAAEDDLEVVPLAFHVDYWNYIGWKDPFSDEAWSRRQRAYAKAARTGRVYTPQLLFDGREHHVGRSAARARAAIEEESRRGDARLAVEVHARESGLEVSVAMAGEAPEDAKVFVALARDGAKTAVRRGENAGQELDEGFIVVQLEQACSFSAGDTCTALLAAPEFSAHVVAFVQRPADMQVFGVASSELPSPPGSVGKDGSAGPSGSG